MENKDILEIAVALNLAKIGRLTIKKILNNIKVDILDLLSLDKDEILSLLFDFLDKNPHLSKLAKFKQIVLSGRHKKEIEDAHKRNIRIISLWDKDFLYMPDILNPPLVLYVRGTLPIQGFFVAVVGTRKATFYGLSVTEKIASQLAEMGAVIVSGGAFGIDKKAHESALKSGGKTIAVLGTGVDVYYPSSNVRLFNEIVESGNGALISEFPLGMRGYASNFPQRNRIIAGISGAVVVVEAPCKSGALITAKFATTAGIDVYAVPGRITDLKSEGTNRLIKDGAFLLMDTSDIVSSFGLLKGKDCDSGRSKADLERSLSDKENRIVKLLLDSNKPQTVDFLCANLGEDYTNLMSLILELELKGVIIRTLDGRVMLA